MKVLIVEANLMWSPRLVKSVVASGHEAVASTRVGLPLPDDWSEIPIAILNLGELGDSAKEIVDAFHANGTIVIAHAGHKEKDLHSLGKEAGCDILATNGELTWKLEKILEKAGNMHSAGSVKHS